jgi:diguanylate cyclase (GGDEF)-like protein
VQTLLTLTVLVEPDLQRLANFVLESARSLEGNCFAAAARVLQLMERLREDSLAANDPLEVELQLYESTLAISWAGQQLNVCTLRSEPTVSDVEALCQQLKQESETADPELLRQRNRKIREDLEAAQQRAAAVEDLEKMLEQKKQELEESIRQAETDSLTGIFNRGAYDMRLKESLARCRRQHDPVSLILFDLDFFKEVNDSHGHQYGDEYLKRMASAMKKCSREDVDLPFRIGGDEFAMVVLAGIDIAERIAGKVLEAMDGKVSIGIAEFDMKESMEELVNRCDAALYSAKEQGRGQYVSDNKTRAGASNEVDKLDSGVMSR